MGNYHVPFWRAVEEATPSLTLIIKNRAVGQSVLKAQLMSVSEAGARRRATAIAGVAEKPTPYFTQLV